MRRITDPSVQSFETEHIAKVRELAPECAVLLKNEGVLPLEGTGKLALFGSGARRTIKGGTGSGDVNVRHYSTVEEGLTNAGFEITSGAWLDSYEDMMNSAKAAWVKEMKDAAKAAGISPVFALMGKVMPEPEYEIPLEGEGDTAVYVLSRISGEGADREPVSGDINLSQTEIRDILALNEKYEKFVLVLNVGGMVNLKPVAAVKCVLLLGQLGTPTGDVCADILLGKSYPSGKLTMTWAPIEEYSTTEGFGDFNDTYYKEGIYVGYRYFDSFGKKPEYPFGYGLSYTTFQITDTGIAADGSKIEVTAVVKNTGSRAGKESVQVYVSAPAGKIDRPYQELRAFAKTAELAPGMSEALTMTFDLTEAAAYCEKCSAWVLEAGDYVVRVGVNSADTQVAGVVKLDETVVTEQAHKVGGDCGFEDIVPPLCADIPCDGAVVVNVAASDIKTVPAKSSECPAALSGERVDWQQVVSGEKTLDDFIGGLTRSELADICIGTYSDDGGVGSVIGAGSALIAGGAGDTTHRVESAGLVSLSMADGPAGLRINKEYKYVNGKVVPIGNALESMMEMLDEDEIYMFGSVPEPSEEELAAPVNYQYCIAIPIGTALAQSFNEDLCFTMGDMVGEEMEIFGVNYWLAPALNIMRSPLCGRNFEYFSEDPFVSGKVAAAITKGVQSHPGCGTTIKHFAVNNQETNRYGSNSVLSERALREIYLKGFEIAVKESAPESIMTSYNLINGEHSCNRADLVNTVLRDEWGYNGLVMTDWYITTSLMVNPGSLHGPASAAGCVKACNNMTMPGTAEDNADILKALEDSTHPYALTDAELQRSARPVLEAVLRLYQG